jgi:hypothetical protein
LEKCEDTKNLKLEDKELFKKFIFEFELSEGKKLIDMRLIAIDTFITPAKVECFRVAMKVANKNISVAGVHENALKKLFVNLETEAEVYKRIVI